MKPEPVYYGHPKYEYATLNFAFSAVGRSELRHERFPPTFIKYSE